ncbi:2439_t:CDS:2 [Funneliformis geosporum]|nr:2439_t:CDS:2 [Funneliformis geosporum]
MATIKLNNFEIKKLEDKNLNPYYLIVNGDNRDEAYFCFESLVKEENINVQNGKAYKRVTALHIDDDDNDDIFV